jgi:ketosteroid isomerase-like protein
MPEGSELGGELARALGAKDFERVTELVHPDVDFLGMTPNRTWQARGPEALVADVLARWFEPSDEIEAVERIATDAFADREHVAYRFRGRNGSGPFVVEQQAYLTVRDGRIDWLRVMCSGFRPV